MRTIIMIHLHEKAVKILEGINKCDEYINYANRMLSNTNKSWYYGTYGYYIKQLEKYTGIKERLINSYAAVIERMDTANKKLINNPVLERYESNMHPLFNEIISNHFTPIS